MHIRYKRVAALAMAAGLTLLPMMLTAKDKPPDKTEPFSEAVAERLMRQVRDGLVAGDADAALAAFDRDNMVGYREFAAQLQEFLRTWENVRVYYQIVQSAEKDCATACGTATVQFEMEANNVQTQLPATRRGAQIELTFQRTDRGWRIVNLTPRDIFQ